MFIANAWYVAAWSRDVTARLIERIILQQSVVLYRLADGTPVGLENRCPHRNMPLSEGWLIDDRVRCFYHGLEFDSGGRCVHIPGQRLPGDNKPAVKTYPVAEKYGWLFIWMGDPALADQAFNSPAFTESSSTSNGTASTGHRCSNAGIG